jgi:hypothetical protein
MKSKKNKSIFVFFVWCGARGRNSSHFPQWRKSMVFRHCDLAGGKAWFSATVIWLAEKHGFPPLRKIKEIQFILPATQLQQSVTLFF